LTHCFNSKLPLCGTKFYFSVLLIIWWGLYRGYLQFRKKIMAVSKKIFTVNLAE